ncbi:MAG: hypothetical protein M0Z27_13705 [Thermaerobacter sp.]|jgi:hypothetical protein|nr:hypothetical protein [Thermaerobacter sp.]MDA8147098.1 hypothetical protein [Thermaerobacter sp.]
MEIVRGRVEEVSVLGDVSATYTVSLASGSTHRVLRFVATRPDLSLSPGDLLEAKLARNPGGEEVMLCRNLSTGQLLVDRVNYQATHMACWLLAGLVVLVLLGWSLTHL